MKSKIVRFNVPGTNVVRPLRHATCRHAGELVPYWSKDGRCTACYVLDLHAAGVIC